jgi:hypothetical protein
MEIGRELGGGGGERGEGARARHRRGNDDYTGETAVTTRSTRERDAARSGSSSACCLPTSPEPRPVHAQLSPDVLPHCAVYMRADNPETGRGVIPAVGMGTTCRMGTTLALLGRARGGPLRIRPFHHTPPVWNEVPPFSFALELDQEENFHSSVRIGDLSCCEFGILRFPVAKNACRSSTC